MKRRDLVDRLLEFDLSDDYHEDDRAITPGAAYYQAIDRAIRLVKGEIKDWTEK